jgi:type I restriction enzyme R subunit
MFTDINTEDRLVQQTFADFLRDNLGWESAYAWNDETFGTAGNLGRDSERDAAYGDIWAGVKGPWLHFRVLRLPL